MAIKGNLQDMSLPSLVQMICADQRKAALVLRHRRVEEGVLFFEDGEIVHAQTGTLEGEDAVYQLLQWTEGTFHLGDKTRIPRRTINAPWHYLMLEGMRKMDEREVGVGVVAPSDILTPRQTAADERLEYQLINLISQLEFSRAKLADKKIRKRPSAALQTVAEMANALVAFTEKKLKINGRSLEKALSLAADHYPAIRLFQIRNNRLQPVVVVTLYHNWSAGKADRSKMFTEMVRGIVEIMESYFVYITSSFHAAETAEQWREACLVFLEELTAALQRVKF